MRIRNLFRPAYLFGRLQNWIYERRHPDHPWLSPDAIVWLEKHLKPNMHMFEWGSGRSTLWFAKRIAKIISVENNLNWFETTSNAVLNQELSNVHLHHIPLEHSEADTYANHYDKLPSYVSIIQEQPSLSLDIVLVDGWYRPVCTLESLSKLKSGGYLIIDNTNWNHPPHFHVPHDWPLLHRSSNVLTETSIWRKP